LMLGVAQRFLTRSVATIWGPQGIGKTAFCREFCYHFSAPGGRLFSKAALFIDAQGLAHIGDRFAANGATDTDPEELRDRLARLVLAELAERGPRGTITALAACGVTAGGAVSAAAESAFPPRAEARWLALLEVARLMDEAEGLWLLVLDGLREPGGAAVAERTLVKALQDLLDASAKLRILLTSRGHWKRLSETKIVGVEMEPLPPRQAALLLARNVHRRLYLHDFEAVRQEPHREEVESELLGHEETFERLEASALLRSLGGVPGLLIEAADEVDERLPSLLQHSSLAGRK